MQFSFLIVLVLGISLKILLIPAYYSTDFDVHHNWLRITSSTPISQWYFDDINKWTLDYPPFFAYFQYTLSLIASLINPIINSLIQTRQSFYFQRFSVIIWQIPLCFVLYFIYDKKVSAEFVFAYLFVPFTILDNIHFQYNIMLQCLFLLSFFFLKAKKFELAAFTYSILLNFKHIYLYCSFAYFFVILKHYVLNQNHSFNQKIKSFLKIAIITITPFVFSFLPFIAVSGIDGLLQIFKRLFPFGRGLIHQYWAPNFWALYHFLDKILSLIFSKASLLLKFQMNNSLSNYSLNSLKILPQPSANMTLFIILLSMIPLLWNFINRKNVNICGMVVISGLCFFFFGYHVHQKAITPYVHLFFICLTCYKQQTKKNQTKQNEKTILHSENKFIFCAIFINIINLMPLLINNKQKPLKLILIVIYVLIWKRFSKFSKIEQYFMIGGFIIVIICEVLSLFLFVKYQFLPLMTNSVFCAVFNMFWLIYLYYIQLNETNNIQQKEITFSNEQDEEKRLLKQY